MKQKHLNTLRSIAISLIDGEPAELSKQDVKFLENQRLLVTCDGWHGQELTVLGWCTVLEYDLLDREYAEIASYLATGAFQLRAWPYGSFWYMDESISGWVRFDDLKEWMGRTHEEN